MLTRLTLDSLRTLKLDGIAEAFAEMQTQGGSADLTHAERLGLLIDREATSSETKREEGWIVDFQAEMTRVFHRELTHL